MTSVASESGKKVLTMDEYISKTALYGEVAKLEELARNRYLDTPSNSPAYPRYTAQMQERAALKHLIADFPADDVAPVRHGKWIHTDLAAHWYGKDECSECTYHEHDRRDLSHFNYCPNCGAKMDGDDDNSAICSKTT